MAKKNPQPKEAIINASSFTGSQYSQLVGVTVTDVDVTLEFMYLNPRDKTKGEVISRVTLPVEVAKNLSGTIANIIKMHEVKKGGKKNDIRDSN